MLDPKGPSNHRSPIAMKKAGSMDARAIDASGRHAGHDTLAPGLALDQIGEALASFYDDLIAEGIPENLAALVRQVHTPEPVSEPDPVVPIPVRKSGRLALVVEDEATTQRLAVSLLDETELEAIGCDSAEEALAVMRDRGGDVALVFADIQLSGVMDGLQLARAVAMLWPTAHMIVTSGRRSPRPDLLPERVVFIPKPWSPKDVLVEAERATHEPPPAVP